MSEIFDIVLDALLDTLKLFPWLVLIYIVIELIEHKTDLAGPKNRLNGKLGPLIGSATGLIPQCGFSVMAAKLFEQKYITLGTLLAIFISTSDEAFIILLSSGEGAVWLLPLIVVKILVGIAVGYAVNGALHLIGHRHVRVHSSHGEAYDAAKEGTDECGKHEGECGAHALFLQKEETREFECTSCGRAHDETRPVMLYFVSPLLHALKVAGFILLVNLILGLIVGAVTEERFMAFMNKNLFAQPFIASLVGLIPNCASSVVITESFLQGGISFGSCAAGLCANAGLGFVVLLKNTKEWKRNLMLIVLCYVIAVAVGSAINGIALAAGRI